MLRQRGKRRSVRLFFAFLRVDECYRDVTTVRHVSYTVAVKTRSEFTTRKGVVMLGFILLFYLALAMIALYFPCSVR